MANSPQTSKLIDELSADLKNPSQTHAWPQRYWRSWLACLLIVGGLTFLSTVVAPELVYLPKDLLQYSFWIESFLWLLASLVSAYCAYRSSFPTWNSSKFKIASTLFLVGLVISAIVRASPYTQNFYAESGWDHGRCGLFILLTAGLTTGWMFYVIRKAAPAKLFETGLWSAASSGSAGIMFMHTVCRQENPLHILLWHVIPFLIVAIVGSTSARKALNW